MAARSRSAPHWKQQVARLRVPRNGKVGVGTGVLISQQHVLTAWHVVAPDGVFVAGSLVDLPDLASPLTNLPATLAWRHDSEDIALLRLESQLQVSPVLQLAQSEPQRAVEGEIYGYARGSDTARDPRERAASSFVARLHTPSIGKPLNIAPEHPADVWSGLSGAPVVYEGEILGVISAKNDWRTCTRLIATSIATWRSVLRAQLAAEPSHTTGGQIDPVAELLETNSAVLEEIARHASVSAHPAQVAAWLRASGKLWLAVFLTTRSGLRSVEGALATLRGLTELLLPHIEEWRVMSNSIANQLAAQRVPRIEAPFLNELLVEAFAAYLDRRRCAFVPESRPLVGRGLVHTGMETGADPTGARFAGSLLADLYRFEGGGLQDHDRGAFALASAVSARFGSGAVTLVEQAKFVEASLKLRIKVNDPSDPPLYVILCDRQDGSADRYLEEVEKRLAVLLPSLRVFRVSLSLSTPDELLEVHAQVQAIFAP